MTVIQHTEPLNRVEADIVVRQLTGEFHNQHGFKSVKADPDTSVFRDFARKLAWQIGGTGTAEFRDYLMDALHAYDGLMDIIWGDRPHTHRGDLETALNVAVNGALVSAGVESAHINRYGEQGPAGLQLSPSGLRIDPVAFSAMAKRLAEDLAA